MSHFFFSSPRTIEYNCIAWAAKNSTRWWQPGAYWPIDSTRDDYGIGELVLAFQCLGFIECEDASLESGYEKVALYSLGMMYTHAARQLPNGLWTSKPGQLADITHATPEVIAGSDYIAVIYNCRRLKSVSCSIPRQPLLRALVGRGKPRNSARQAGPAFAPPR